MKLPPRAIATMGAGAVALASVVAANWEGLKLIGYPDLGGVATACRGNTDQAVIGKRYSLAECDAMFQRDLKRHADLIRPCVPAGTPVESQAAFLSLAYNIGGKAFCTSSVARKLAAGDLVGACAGISAWVYVKGKRVQGLANRRADERKLCELGAHNMQLAAWRYERHGWNLKRFYIPGHIMLANPVWV